MAKQKPQPISSPPPVKAKQRDLEPLKQVLRDEGVTFEGARRGYGVGLGDKEAVLKAAEKAMDVMSRNKALTAAHSAYWSLYDERKK